MKKNVLLVVGTVLVTLLVMSVVSWFLTQQRLQAELVQWAIMQRQIQMEAAKRQGLGKEPKIEDVLPGKTVGNPATSREPK